MAAPHSTLAETKRLARASAVTLRTGLLPALGVRLAGHVLDAGLIPPRAVVSGFWPLDGEIDIRPLLLALIGRGHLITLPITPPRGQPLRFARWRPGEAMVPGPFGTRYPLGEALTPDLLLVPLLAFDARGGRLGYGAGYYDRTLAALPGHRSIGCAFARQQVASVPAGPTDMRLHAVATECGVILCKD